MSRHSGLLQLEGTFCILLAMMFLVLPLRWLMAVIFAMGFHECCHFWMLRILGVEVYTLRLGVSGAAMETEPMTSGRELLAAIAGPLGSGVLVLLIPWAPRIGICGLIHCLYNLLPLFPMDGGRVLRSALRLWLPHRLAEKIFGGTQKVLGFILLLLCIFLVHFKMTVVLPVLIFLLWKRLHKRTV